MVLARLAPWLLACLAACGSVQPLPAPHEAESEPTRKAEESPRVAAPESPPPEGAAPVEAAQFPRLGMFPIIRGTHAYTDGSTMRVKRVPLAQVPAFLRGAFDDGDTVTLTSAQQPFDFGPALHSGKGILAVTDPYGHTALHAFSELSPMLKIGPRGGLVWVTRLIDGAPVGGVNVEVVSDGKRVARGRSNAEGLFLFDLPKGSANRVVFGLVKHGDDESFASYANAPDGNLHMFFSPRDLGTHDESALPDGKIVALFTARSWYRVGERVRFFGVARQFVGARSRPVGGSVRVRAWVSSTTPTHTLSLPLSDTGMFEGELVLPLELDPNWGDEGMLRLEATLPGGSHADELTLDYGRTPTLTDSQRNEPSERSLWHEAPVVADPPAPFVPVDAAWNLTFQTDKAEYQVGDVAHLRLSSPFPAAHALVTVEKDRVLSAMVKRVDGPTPVVDLPLEASFAPSSAVTVTMLRAQTHEPETDLLMVAHGLQVGSRAYRLDAHLTLSPGSQNAMVQVHDANGKAVESDLLVVVADDAFLPSRQPDAFGRLFSRPHEVISYDAHFAAIGCDFGGAEGMPTDARPSEADGALLFARLRTDAKGQASIAIPPRPTERAHTVFVLASARSGALGFATLPLLGSQEAHDTSNMPTGG